MNYTNPTKEYQRLVIAGQMHHNNNPILSWQAGHVMTYKDANHNERPIKPKTGDRRKIDGMVAEIMALRGAMSYEGPKQSVYATRGLAIG